MEKEMMIQKRPVLPVFFYVWKAGLLERQESRHEGRNFNELGEKSVCNPKFLINIHNKAKKW